MKKYCPDCKPNGRQFDSMKQYENHLDDLTVYEQSYHTVLDKWEVKTGENAVLDVRELNDWQKFTLKDDPLMVQPVRCALTGRKIKIGDEMYHYVNMVYDEKRDKRVRRGSFSISSEAKQQIKNFRENTSLVKWLSAKNAINRLTAIHTQ